jgi:hypothetical protein
MSGAISMYWKMLKTMRGMRPRSGPSMSGPSIVNVLPDDVWPYAKMVPL